jgi:hypothetical protein
MKSVLNPMMVAVYGKLSIYLLTDSLTQVGEDWDMNHVAVTIAKQHRYEINARTVALISQAEKTNTQTQPTNKSNIAANIAVANANATASLTLLQRMTFLESSLLHQLRYLETGNIKDWQTFIHKSIHEFKALGFDYHQLTKSGRLSLQALWEFFQKKLPTVGSTIEGVTTEQYLKNLRLKLDCLDLVATTAGMALGLNPA